MVCIYCGGSTHVTNSRKQKRSNGIWRRRQCASCQAVFTTVEQPDLSANIMVVSGDNDSLLPFSRDLLFASIWESCKHRPTALTDATSLTATVIQAILHEKTASLTSKQVAARTYELLERFDPTAGAVYKAYHLT